MGGVGALKGKKIGTEVDPSTREVVGIATMCCVLGPIVFPNSPTPSHQHATPLTRTTHTLVVSHVVSSSFFL